MKKGILFAAHGSQRTATASAMDKIVKKADLLYPDAIKRKAYTSFHVRKLMKERGKHLPSVEETLYEMREQGVTHVVVQSLHVIPGIEFHHITRTLAKIEKGEIGFEHAEFGQPLLSDDTDVEEVSDLILDQIKERNPETDGLILVAHGSRHSGNIFYHKFKLVLEAKDQNAYLGAISSDTDIFEISKKLQQSKIKKAFLIPLLFGAGNHVQEDMNGNHAESWKNIVADHGIEPVAIPKGIGEFDVFVERWMNNLHTAMDKIK